MLYSCTHMATVGVKGLSDDDVHLSVCLSPSNDTDDVFEGESSSLVNVDVC